MPSAGDRASSGPFAIFNFTVEIDDREIGIAEVIGLGAAFEYEAGSATVSVRPNEVLLRRAITGDAELWAWVRNPTRGKVETRTVTVNLLDETRKPVCSWVLPDARLTSWRGPALNALDGDIAMEEIGVVADRVNFVPHRRAPARRRARL